MGTRVRIVAEASRDSVSTAASEAALREIERMEGLLSTWDPESALGRLNALPIGTSVEVEEELAALLSEAEAWAERTGRAFDPTVGALLDAWQVRGEGRVPSDEALRGALAATGPGAMAISGGRAERRAAGAWIDSGAFGKGAALRSAASAARHSGAVRFLIDLGGQIWAEAEAEAAWPVEVAHPRERHWTVVRLRVHGVSVATSGASERPGHLLDPRNGRPVTDWGSVTVGTADPLEADVLSTALYVMEPDVGFEWAQAHGVAALFLEATPEGLVVTPTRAMVAWQATARETKHEQSNHP